MSLTPGPALVIILRNRAKTISGTAQRAARTEQVAGWSGALLALWLLVGAPCGAWGHLPEGVVHRAFQFPDALVPEIDGDLDDWRLVDPSYVVVTEDLFELVREGQAELDPLNFSARLMVGWNKAANQLYVAAEVRDNRHQVDRPAGEHFRIFQDDGLTVFLDADHSGGQFANFPELSPDEQRRLNGATANHFVVSGPPPDGVFFVNYSAAAWYALPDGPYTRAAYEVRGTVGGPAVVTYELMLVPFDRVDMDAVFLSDEHRMAEDEVLGLGVEFHDFDVDPEIYEGNWSLSGGQNAQVFSERFSDLHLMPLEDMFRPTVVESRSWARIKASFAP